MTAAPDDCEQCRQASAGMWHGYRTQCTGCTARAIARSLIAFNAARPNAGPEDKAALRELYARALPGIPTKEAHAAMLHWWRIDHP